MTVEELCDLIQYSGVLHKRATKSKPYRPNKQAMLRMFQSIFGTIDDTYAVQVHKDGSYKHYSIDGISHLSESQLEVHESRMAEVLAIMERLFNVDEIYLAVFSRPAIFETEANREGDLVS